MGPDTEHPVLELAIDGFGGQPEASPEFTGAVQRLDNGEGPVRFRLVVCGETLVDEVVSSWEELFEFFPPETRTAIRAAGMLLEDLRAEWRPAAPDSVAPGLRMLSEWMSPAERDEVSAELERLEPVLFYRETLDTISPEALGKWLPGMAEMLCEDLQDLVKRDLEDHVRP